MRRHEVLYEITYLKDGKPVTLEKWAHMPDIESAKRWIERYLSKRGITDARYDIYLIKGIDQND